MSKSGGHAWRFGLWMAGEGKPGRFGEPSLGRQRDCLCRRCAATCLLFFLSITVNYIVISRYQYIVIHVAGYSTI